MDMRIDIKSLDFEELNNLVLELGEKSFRAKQIYEWLHVKLVHSFEEMSNLSKNLRDKLNEKCFLTALKPVEILTSKVDGTKKYLFELQDGNIIESVLMRYHHGNSVCISTQVGCRMGCKFCASTLDGLERNLLPSEMLDEIYTIQKDIGERVSNIVLMGSGEPLDNYDNVMKFLKLISDDYGLNISQRNITLSTCGLVPKIYELADSQVQITLAISLHASEDEIRKELMPVAKAYKIEEILKACNYYFDKGVEYGILASEITCSEMVEIKKNTSMKLFAFILGYPIMAHSRRRLLTNYYSSQNREYDSTLKKISEHDKEYIVSDNSDGACIYEGDIINGTGYINDLSDSGIEYGIIHGFNIDERLLERLILLTKEVLDNNSASSLEEIKTLIGNNTGFFDKKTIFKVKKDEK
jgi:23S rRNA (adenine2503-C2)-methyltransferase